MSGRVHKEVCHRVEAAFAQAKVRAVHVPDVAVALERVGNSMPQVVVLLGKPGDHANGETLADCTEAIGAGLVYIDPMLDVGTLEDAIHDAVDTAIKCKLRLDEKLRKEPEEAADAADAADIPVAFDADDADVDEGW